MRKTFLQNACATAISLPVTWCCWPPAVYGSYVLRLETLDLGAHWPGCLLLIGLALLIVPLVFYRAGIYTRYWRYASTDELMLLAGSVTINRAADRCAGLAGGWFVARRLAPPPLDSPDLSAAGAGRHGRPAPPAASLDPTLHGIGRAQRQRGARQAVLIMGAGDAGAIIVREMRRNPHLGLDPIGFLDDDPNKLGMRIHGVPVLGDRHAIPELAQGYHVRQVIIAMPTASGQAIREVSDVCQAAGVRARIMPACTSC